MVAVGVTLAAAVRATGAWWVTVASWEWLDEAPPNPKSTVRTTAGVVMIRLMFMCAA
jgi:hypothetical protein